MAAVFTVAMILASTRASSRLRDDDDGPISAVDERCSQDACGSPKYQADEYSSGIVHVSLAYSWEVS